MIKPNPYQQANRRAAIGFMILAALLLGAALGANQPVLALAAMIFFLAGIIVASKA